MPRFSSLVIGPVVVLADGPDPHLQDVLVVRGEVGEVLAVGRDLRAGLLRVAEQHVPRNERRQFGQGRGGEDRGQAQREDGTDHQGASEEWGDASAEWFARGRR